MSHCPTLGGPLGPPVKFPAAVISHLDVSNRSGKKLLARGSLTTGNNLGNLSPIAIIYQGSNLEVLCPRTGQRLAAWTFHRDEDITRDYSDGVTGRSTEITCVAELTMNVTRQQTGSVPCSDDASFVSSVSSHRHHVRRFVVAGLSSGLVCVIDISSCRLIRVIRMPHRVTSLTVVGSAGSTEQEIGSASLLEDKIFSEELHFFHGIIAVGTQEGHLYLLDAGLDLTEVVETEKNPAEPYFISAATLKKPENFAALRSAVHRRGEHLCMTLNESSYAGAKNVFVHQCSSSGQVTYFPEDGVVISSLHYVPQLASILVGFNFGSWQMWSTSRLCLVFASTYDGSDPSIGSARSSNVLTLPVTNFAFAEPENDPRNFCYIWVARGESDFDNMEEKMEIKSKSTLSLYALCYKNRDHGGDLYGTLYSGLQSCSLKFDHVLLGDPQSTSENREIGSICLSCVTMGAAVTALKPGNDESDPESGLCKAGITVFLWEVTFANIENPQDRMTKYYLGIFDINAWYLAQLPCQVDLREGELCSYFSYCCMDELRESTDSQLINVWFDPSSVSRYNLATSSVLVPALYTDQPEQQFYPSSLTFEIVCCFDQSFVHTNYLGLQRKVLLELQSDSSLVEPLDLYNLCEIAGFIKTSPQSNLQETESINGSSGEETTDTVPRLSEADMRSALLTVALENNLINLLTTCIVQWSDGRYSERGCTLRFILDWAWNTVSNIKQAVDKATTCLFDFSETEMTEATRQSLMHRSQYLHSLCTVIKKSYQYFASNEIQLFKIIDQQLPLKLHLARLISTYLDVILRFIVTGLLPERTEDSGLTLFPVTHMRKVYAEKRQRMVDLFSTWNESDSFGDERFRESCTLMIDGLCNDLGEKFKENLEREGGLGLYPPPSLHSLLISYLIHNQPASVAEEIDTTQDLLRKHRIVQYLFLDLTSCLTNNDEYDEANSAVVDSLIKFPSAFGMPPSVIKLTQAFWLVDHEDFDEAITMLLDPLVRPEDISDWQHRAIIMSFLIQGRSKLALKYLRMRQPPLKEISDAQLHVSVLVSNSMFLEAFQFLRQRWSHGPETELQILLYFFFSRCDALGKLNSILQLPMLPKEESVLVDFLMNSDDNNMSRKEILLMYYLQRARFTEALELNERLEQRFGNCSKTRKAIMTRYAHLLPKRDSSTLQIRWPSTSRSYSQPIAAMMMSARAHPTFQSEAKFRKMSELPHPSNEFTPFRPRYLRRKFAEIDDEGPDDVFGNGENGSVSKRSRLDLESPPPALKVSQHGSLLSILNTPAIDKKKPESFLGRSRQESLSSEVPHSILKVKGAALEERSREAESASPLSLLFKANRRLKEANDDNDDSWLSRHRMKRLSTSRESTPGKSLRFNVPKQLPPPELKTPEESILEASNEADTPGEVLEKFEEQSVQKTSDGLYIVTHVEKSVSRTPPKLVESFEISELKKSETSLPTEDEEKPESSILDQTRDEDQLKVSAPARARAEDDDSIDLVSNSDDESSVLEQKNDSVEETYDIDSELYEEQLKAHRGASDTGDKSLDQSVGDSQEEIFATPESESKKKKSSEESLKECDTSSVDKSTARSELSIFLPNETMEVDQSFIQKLIEKDKKEASVGVAAEKSIISPVSSTNSDPNVTTLGQDVTMEVDMSFIRHLWKKDSEREAQELVTARCQSDETMTDEASRTIDFIEGGNKTLPVDESFIKELVAKERENKVSDESGGECFVNKTFVASDIDFGEGTSRVVDPDEDEISFKTPKRVPQSPSARSSQKRKRFADTSFSKLESILEEGVDISTQLFSGKDDRFRFRVDSPLKRSRTISDSAASPAKRTTPSRRRSSRSAAEASSDQASSDSELRNIHLTETKQAETIKPPMTDQAANVVAAAPSVQAVGLRGRKSASFTQPSPLVTPGRRRTRSSISVTENEPPIEMTFLGTLSTADEVSLPPTPEPPTTEEDEETQSSPKKESEKLLVSVDAHAQWAEDSNDDLEAEQLPLANSSVPSTEKMESSNTDEFKQATGDTTKEARQELSEIQEEKSEKVVETSQTDEDVIAETSLNDKLVITETSKSDLVAELPKIPSVETTPSRKSEVIIDESKPVATNDSIKSATVSNEPRKSESVIDVVSPEKTLNQTSSRMARKSDAVTDDLKPVSSEKSSKTAAPSCKTRNSESVVTESVLVSPGKSVKTTPSRRTRKSDAITDELQHVSPEKPSKQATPSRRARNSDSVVTESVSVSPGKSVKMTPSRRTRKSDAITDELQHVSPEKLSKQATPSRRTRKSDSVVTESVLVSPGKSVKTTPSRRTRKSNAITDELRPVSPEKLSKTDTPSRRARKSESVVDEESGSALPQKLVKPTAPSRRARKSESIVTESDLPEKTVKTGTPLRRIRNSSVAIDESGPVTPEKSVETSTLSRRTRKSVSQKSEVEKHPEDSSPTTVEFGRPSRSTSTPSKTADSSAKTLDRDTAMTESEATPSRRRTRSSPSTRATPNRRGRSATQVPQLSPICEHRQFDEFEPQEEPVASVSDLPKRGTRSSSRTETKPEPEVSKEAGTSRTSKRVSRSSKSDVVVNVDPFSPVVMNFEHPTSATNKPPPKKVKYVTKRIVKSYRID